VPLDRRSRIEARPERRPQREATDGKARRRLRPEYLAVGEHDGGYPLFQRRRGEEAGDEVLADSMGVAGGAAAVIEGAGPLLERQNPLHDVEAAGLVSCATQVHELMGPPDYRHDGAGTTTIRDFRLHVVDQVTNQRLVIRARVAQGAPGQHALPGTQLGEVEGQPLDPLDAGRRAQRGLCWKAAMIRLKGMGLPGRSDRVGVEQSAATHDRFDRLGVPDIDQGVFGEHDEIGNFTGRDQPE
jgi:hypothetical protein